MTIEFYVKFMQLEIGLFEVLSPSKTNNMKEAWMLEVILEINFKGRTIIFSPGVIVIGKKLSA